MLVRRIECRALGAHLFPLPPPPALTAPPPPLPLIPPPPPPCPLRQAAPVPTNPLRLPTRLQWTNAGGFCGETSAQTLALYHGAWVSQGAWRLAGGGGLSVYGQLLIGVSLEGVLTKMGLNHTSWNYFNAAEPQYGGFTRWVGAQLAGGASGVIMGVYVTDGNDDPNYDHIVPAVGLSPASSPGGAALTYFDLYNLAPQVRPLSSLGASRASCRRSLDAGGCLPAGVDYGTAVTGVLDGTKQMPRVRLAVDRVDEPNWSPVDPSDPDEYRSAPEKPVALHGTVTVSGLTKGVSYRLMRFASAAKVPKAGATAAQYLAAAYVARVDFTAAGPTWTYTDPQTILSSSTVFYRCVPR